MSCTRPFSQPSTGVAWSLAPLDAATAPPAAAAAVAPPHLVMITAASSDASFQSPDYSSQQPIHASATTTSLASSTAYAETSASSTQQTASIIVPLRSVTPLSDVDEDLQRIIAEDYADATTQIAPSASLLPATSEPTSSSLRSPEALSSFSASVQPLYTAQSPVAQTSLNVASPVQSPLPLAALPAAAASPAASSVSADTGAFADDRRLQVALAAHVLWLASERKLYSRALAGTETTAQQVTDEASRELITLGGFCEPARDAVASAFAPADASMASDFRSASPLARLAVLLSNYYINCF